jgi:membrane-bound inhibitor of C-type lysozyme
MFKISLLAACLALAACATVDLATGSSIRWRCDGGVTFVARNTIYGNAEVMAAGHTYRLPGVMAASGVRYFDGTIEYWEHGEEAMLNGASGGPYANCRR